MSGQIPGISNLVEELEEEFYRVMKEDDGDIDECLKMIRRLQHMLICFEERVRNRREKAIIARLEALQKQVRMVSTNIGDVVFKPPVRTD